MTLNDLMKVYTGNACISIEGYCEEEEYDYYLLPDSEEEDFSGNNPNDYIPSCLAKEPWWEEVKNRQIENFSIIGGGLERAELYVCLKD